MFKILSNSEAEYQASYNILPTHIIETINLAKINFYKIKLMVNNFENSKVLSMYVQKKDKEYIEQIKIELLKDNWEFLDVQRFTGDQYILLSFELTK